ncbi:hypothetical protein Cpir12675_000173 [Ceratocystis pirilliformis]|uniref:Membrane protein C24H6.13 n=1 Tax=Ceratocystis pirilliformis TaxID=259994 RepID=A0ABR3ZPP4_9PEZI
MDSLTNSSSDPRLNSATANSTGGTLSKISVSGTSKSSASASALISTLIPVIVYSALCLSIFWLLRHKFPRVYSPRTILTSFLPQERSQPLPGHLFKWVTAFFKVEDTFALQHISLDAYFFLRFLKVLSGLCFVGVCITWPILLPIHARGGSGLKQLDSLTIGNVTEKKTFVVHALVCWLYFTIVLYTIYRECIFYINLRNAYMFSPYQAQRLSSRTVLFTSVPPRYRDPARLRKLFGDSVRNVWIPKDTSDLEKLVEEREQTALRLEKAEIVLIKLANRLRKKAMGQEPPSEAEQLDPQFQPDFVLGEKLSTQSEVPSSSSPETLSDSHVPGNKDIFVGSSASPPIHDQHIPPKPTITSDFQQSKVDIQEQIIALDALQQESSNDSTINGTGSKIASLSSPPPSEAAPASPIKSECAIDDEKVPYVLTEAPEPISTLTKLQADDEGKVWCEVQQDTQTQPEANNVPATKDHSIDVEVAHPRLPDVNGSVAAQWVPAEMRPAHRPLANFFRRVDTIKWTRKRIRIINPQIRKMRKMLLQGEGKPLASAFVEFTNQADAEKAYQTLTHHLPSHMSSRYIGVTPDEIVWTSLNLTWLSLLIRKFGIAGATFVGIIFWSIPSAFVGAISNVEALAKYVTFLDFVLKFPEFVKGIIQGFLPAIMLSLLMAIVPYLLRGAARTAGVPSLSLIELFVQESYFPFQVVQVFLITTISSAASAALMEVVKSPFSAPSLLSENLPKASNFYISYILVQCLAAGAGAMVHLVDIFRHQILARNMDYPRSAFRVWHQVRPVHWGAIFPVFTNMGVIAFSYCCIAPVIMIFASCGIFVIYLVYRYNLMFTYNSNINCRGLVYPNALLQLLTGLYLAEICMIGLLALRVALVPMVMMVMFLIFTAMCHVSMSAAIRPLLYNLPQSLAVESHELAHGGNFNIGSDDVIPDDVTRTANGDTNIRLKAPSADVDDGYIIPKHSSDVDHEEIASRGMEGADRFVTSIFSIGKLKLSEVTQALDKTPIGPVATYLNRWISPPRDMEPGFVMRWLHPEVFDDFAAMQKLLPPELPNPTLTYPEDYSSKAYWPPAMSAPPMRLWIPRDEAGVSKQEVEHTSKVVSISDEGAELLPNGRIRADVEKAPFFEERIVY